MVDVLGVMRPVAGSIVGSAREPVFAEYIANVIHKIKINRLLMCPIFRLQLRSIRGGRSMGCCLGPVIEAVSFMLCGLWRLWRVRPVSWRTVVYRE
ncbi:hypothetical protein A1395_07270 [Pseudomonas protegens]|uniref:Uncharacterized protein n=1 Tax=Pseudomonas protegens TaxID=380021 RepID=A0A9Q6ICB1_9PSED|nr:hypothetical protein A1395_07270 [Pseudomonas protegens]PYC31259.1 hypothetical protein DMX08_25195 [Pseudomonas protegens]